MTFELLVFHIAVTFDLVVFHIAVTFDLVVLNVILVRFSQVAPNSKTADCIYNELEWNLGLGDTTNTVYIYSCKVQLQSLVFSLPFEIDNQITRWPLLRAGCIILTCADVCARMSKNITFKVKVYGLPVLAQLMLSSMIFHLYL